MKKKPLRLLALSLAFWMLSGCGKTPEPKSAAEVVATMAATSAAGKTHPGAAPSSTRPPEGTAKERELPWPSRDGVHADVDFAEMEWYLYDLSEFETKADELSEGKGEAEELYSWLLAEYKRLQTLDELAWIDFYAHGGEEASERCRLTDELLNSAGDRLYAAVSDALEGPAGKSFSAFLGEDSELLSDYEEMSDREVELRNRDSELEIAYNALLDREDLSDPERFEEIGEVYREMIAVRNELSEIYGYDTFADYAYESYYARDYTPEDAAALCEAIRPYARRYYSDCCYSEAFYSDTLPEEQWEPEELMAMLGEYAPRVSPRAAEAQAYMAGHGLYLLGDEEEIGELGFTTTLEYYNAPFLYNSLSGSIYDVQSCIHEFGHYCDAWMNPTPNVLTSSGSYDIFEIHSTGLEALSYFWYDELFGEAAEKARIYCLDGLMYNVTSGCIYDEFQRYAYAHPEQTTEELCDAYAEIRASYGDPLWDEEGRYDWMLVSHNFSSPFYYISYAASALASLQLWSRAEEDFDAALELYNRLVSLGAYDRGYCELMEETGLALFTEDLDGCVGAPLRALRQMCRRYDGRFGLSDRILENIQSAA